MKTSKELRREAWKALWQNANILKLVGAWATLIGLCLAAVFLIASAFGFFSNPPPFAEPQSAFAELAVRFVSTLFQAVMALGLSAILLEIIDGGERVFRRAFFGFKYPFRAIWLQLVLGFYLFAWMLPALALLIGSVLLTQNQLLVFVSSMIAGVYAFAVTYRFRLVWFVKAESPDLGAVATIRRAEELMNGEKMRLFRLDLSYVLASLWVFVPVVGWAILVSYVALGTAAFYRDLKGQPSVED